MGTREFGVPLELDAFDRISRETKHIVALKPGGEHYMIDFDEEIVNVEYLTHRVLET